LISPLDGAWASAAEEARATAKLQMRATFMGATS
jgi:hypothetical protein